MEGWFPSHSCNGTRVRVHLPGETHGSGVEGVEALNLRAGLANGSPVPSKTAFTPTIWGHPPESRTTIIIMFCFQSDPLQPPHGIIDGVNINAVFNAVMDPWGLLASGVRVTQEVTLRGVRHHHISHVDTHKIPIDTYRYL
jgi:hypothetical protein